jgi:seryl-tRNA synthetase
MGRMIIAIMENYQQADGSIRIPAALRSVVGKDHLTPSADPGSKGK